MNDKPLFFTRESITKFIKSDTLVSVTMYKHCPYVSATAMSFIPNRKKIKPIPDVTSLIPDGATPDVINSTVAPATDVTPARISTNRSHNPRSMNRSNQLVVDLIRNNFTDKSKLTIHVVLTFRDVMYDYETAMSHWKLFIDNLRHHYKRATLLVCIRLSCRG